MATNAKKKMGDKKFNEFISFLDSLKAKTGSTGLDWPSIVQKMETIQKQEPVESIREASRKLGVGEGTLYTFKDNETAKSSLGE